MVVVVVMMMMMMKMTKHDSPLKFHSLNTVFKALHNVASANLFSSSHCFPTQMVYHSGLLPLCLSLCLSFLAFLLYLMWHGCIFSSKFSFSVPISLAFPSFCPRVCGQTLVAAIRMLSYCFLHPLPTHSQTQTVSSYKIHL